MQTYMDAEIVPGARLNLVLGPNGRYPIPERSCMFLKIAVACSCCCVIYAPFQPLTHGLWTGTGKSSLVNAICLGLAGNTSVRSRFRPLNLAETSVPSLICEAFVACKMNTKFKWPDDLSVQLLGRADNVRDFVRRGESSGFVQIWLTTGKTPNDIVNIRRTLDARENSSEWRINGAPRLCKKHGHQRQSTAVCA